MTDPTPALWPTAFQAIMAGQSPVIPGPLTETAQRLPNACEACGDCYHPSFGPNTDGEPCPWCRDCGCQESEHALSTPPEEGEARA